MGKRMSAMRGFEIQRNPDSGDDSLSNLTVSNLCKRNLNASIAGRWYGDPDFGVDLGEWPMLDR